MKKVLLAVGVAVVAVASVPLWGGCDLNGKLCTSWCEIRHFNSELKVAGCRARCATDKLKCLAETGGDKVGDFIEGFQR